MKQTLEQKQAEKQRLSRAYRARKRQEWADLFRQEPRLSAFKKAVRRQRSGAGLLILTADSWVRQAPTEVRFAALRIIDAQANRLARQQGWQALDDPIPPARNPFLIAREMLAVR
jgi:hypothetical protein